MKKGYLSEYFTSFAYKRLSRVESRPEVSNQHELNGVNELRELFGSNKKENIPAEFIYLSDKEDTNTETTLGRFTWYDARENHPTRSEWRLYYSSNDITKKFQENMFLIIAKRSDQDNTQLIIVEPESTSERQLMWLFGISEVENNKSFNSSIISEYSDNDIKLNYSVKNLLRSLNIEVEEENTQLLDVMLRRFNGVFPSTDKFSKFARENSPIISPIESPDEAVMEWMNQEEVLYTTYEKHFISIRLKEGFDLEKDGVSDFLSFGLTVQNRRKSRAGFALENHLAQILLDNKLQFSTGSNARTENNSKPDFLFPSGKKYHNESFPSDLLTMLGSKTTCKDRWRQVLAEAQRIDEKHLFTLETSISTNQTNEMKSNNLQLVVPSPLHNTYSIDQQSWLLSLKSFIILVKEKQERKLIDAFR